MLNPSQARHCLLCRPCSQMEPPPQLLHELHGLLTRPCSQMEAPPQLLHGLLLRPCSQREAPPQLLHLLFTRPCSQMEVPPQLLRDPPHFRHLLFSLSLFGGCEDTSFRSEARCPSSRRRGGWQRERCFWREARALNPTQH